MREPVVLVRLALEGFDLADALQIIHQQRIHGAGGLALDPVAAMGGEGVPYGAQSQEGQGDSRHRGEGRVGGEHDRRYTNDAQQGDAALLGPVDEHALDGIDVLDHPRHQVPRGALVEVVCRQPLQSRIDIAAHVVNDVLLEAVVDADAQAVEKVAQQEGAQQREHHRREQVNAFMADDLVDEELRELWIRESKGQREQGAPNGARSHEFVGTQVHRHPPQDLPGGAGLRGERRVRVAGARAGLPQRFRSVRHVL